MRKLLFTAALLFSMQLGFSEAPKAAPENTNPGYEVCVTLNICGHLCMVCGTFAEMEVQRHVWQSIYCIR